ncbi:MAG: hypothetical protein R3Y63_14995, partial [Eubacteriales bacterium]
GKKQYGYLPPKMKNLVDEIVNQLGKIPEVEQCYELWWQTQQQIHLTYSDDTKEKPSLSQCKDFKSIKNMVIQEAMKYEPSTIHLKEADGWDEVDYEDLSQRETDADRPPPTGQQWSEDFDFPEPEEKPKTKNKFWESSPKNWWNKDFKEAKKFLYGNEKENILQDLEKALEMFAEQETNPLAQLELGKMYAKGLGCEVDVAKARECEEEAFSLFLERETEKPWQYTQYRIGKMYATGTGVEQNYEKSIEFLTKAYEADPEKPYVYSAYTLAGLYKRGLGVETDLEKAFQFYKEAAEGDFPFADFEVAKSFETGSGTEIDLAKAQEYYQKALEGFVKLEEQGDDDKLQYRLGKMFLDGKGTEVDVEKAMEYFGKSAKVGNQFAQYTLGKLYFFGEEIPQDKEKAWDYLNQSAQQGNEYAQFYVDHFQTLTSSGQPSIPFQVGQLLNQLSKVFEENLPPLPHKARHRLDRKRMLQLAEKKQAQGHKRDDFSQQMNY